MATRLIVTFCFLLNATRPQGKKLVSSRLPRRHMEPTPRVTKTGNATDPKGCAFDGLSRPLVSHRTGITRVSARQKDGQTS
ncbi:hypothetical protein F5Y10DRAFT_116478 [Nemania abortiva]|nr:hypothetical protein F5Y10DRAFT_116478 [Nemania abortiva]